MKRLAILLLAIPTSLLATLSSTDRGVGSNNAAATSITISPTSDIASGSTGVLVLAMDNANGASGNLSATSYTDSVGNVWYVKVQGIGAAANTNAEGATLAARLTSTLHSTDTLTINFNASTTAKAWTWTEVDASAGNVALFYNGSWVASSAGGAPSVNTSNISNGNIIIGGGAAESADTWVGDADTSNGSWSTKQSTGVGSGATGISVISQVKVVSANAAQTFNPTLTAADARVGMIVLTETDPKARTIDSSSTSEATTTVGIYLPIASGSISVLCIAADNAGTNGAVTNLPSTLTDTKSNTWTLRQNAVFDNGAASAGSEVGIYTSVLTAQLVPGDTIPITYTIANVPSKAWCIWEFAPAGGGTMSYVTGSVTAGSTTTTPSVTTSSIASGDYVIGASATEAADTVTAFDTDTTNGSWKTQASSAANSGAGGMALASQWKLTTATATQTFNITTSGSTDNILGWAQVHESAAAGGFLQLFP